MTRTAFVSAIVAMTCCGACTPSAPVPELDLTASLPPVAAQYTTATRSGGSRHTVEWRIWRQPHDIAVEGIEGVTGERWQRDGNTIFHHQVFHTDRRAITFQMADLQMIGTDASWARQALVFDPRLLESLRNSEAGWRNGYPFRRYVGEIDGVAWDVTLRMDLLVPTSIEQRRNGFVRRTRIEHVYVPEQAPWQPTSTAGYLFIDFADLGDMERDPFVLRVQNQLGLGHSH